MALESLNGADKFIDDLVNTNPAATDTKNQGDDHLRGIKNVLLNSFPNISSAVSLTAGDMGFLNGIGAQGVTNKLIAGDSASVAVVISVGPGLSLNLSASNLTLALAAGTGISVSGVSVMLGLDNLTAEQSVGASLNFNQVLKKTQVKGGMEVGSSINASGTVVIDFGAAHFYHIVVNDSCTLEVSNVPAAGLATGATLWLELGSDGAVMSHAQSVTWAAGTAHSLTGSVGADDVVVYNAFGSKLFGFTGGQEMA